MALTDVRAGVATAPPSPAALLLHPSNLLTYGALCAGVAAAMAAVRGDAAGTGLGIAAAMIADTFDGRFARRFARSPMQRAFGVQLDSLADAVNAGLVPVVALAALAGRPSGAAAALWWAAACLYVACAVTRLGYYNLTHENDRWFIGLPTPVPALLVATALLSPPGAWQAAALLAGCGVAMVAPLRVPRPRGVGLAAFAGWALLLVVLHGVRLVG